MIISPINTELFVRVIPINPNLERVICSRTMVKKGPLRLLAEKLSKHKKTDMTLQLQINKLITSTSVHA